MSILVTGATGSIGKQIVKQLGEHGVKVKAMTGFESISWTYFSRDC